MPGQENNTKKITVQLTIMLLIQLITIFLSFMYAFRGVYGPDNRPSNLWSMIWGKGVGLVQLLSGVISLILGICGLVMSKGDKTQIILSIILLASLFLSFISLVFAIGSNF